MCVCMCWFAGWVCLYVLVHVPHSLILFSTFLYIFSSLVSHLFICNSTHLGNDVVIEVATIRPFTVDEGYFLLLPITIGELSTQHSYDVVEAA